MTRLFLWLARQVTDPINLLAFYFIWIGIPLIESDETICTRVMIFGLIATPAALGFAIGRRLC